MIKVLQCEVVEMRQTGSLYRLMMGCCAYGTEPFGTTNGGEFLTNCSIVIILKW